MKTYLEGKLKLDYDAKVEAQAAILPVQMVDVWVDPQGIHPVPERPLLLALSQGRGKPTLMTRAKVTKNYS